MSRKKPSLRTCLGLGTGLQEGGGARIRKRPSTKNSARKDTSRSSNRGEHGGGTTSKGQQARRREEKAAQKNNSVIWVSIETNPESSLALKTIAAVTSSDMLEDGISREAAANEDQD